MSYVTISRPLTADVPTTTEHWRLPQTREMSFEAVALAGQLKRAVKASPTREACWQEMRAYMRSRGHPVDSPSTSRTVRYWTGFFYPGED